ncbi:carboxyl-terminal processing protease [Proteiniborus sp. DW1]|uniref:S41 family peptidase n=1 Tax=Proteiniborus sp. DW1 TaxID=1889883 RepID=UPI00092E170A|nr:S41 family peptidase [Proteiniborus sp. DW1]SCG81800.1 carboxyl-terminal processing protease [Proteiniborus sp. DW1]
MEIKSTLKKGILILLIFTLIVSTPSTLAFGQEESSIQQQEEIDLQQELESLGNLLKLIKANYAYEVTEKQLIEGAMKGLFYNLDDYSNYYTEEEFKELNETVSGDFGGIGLYVTEKNGNITVLTPIKDTPAFKAGIKPEDIMVSVDDIDIRGISLKKATDLMRGEPGTKVKIGIVRRGESKPLYFNIVRELIQLNPVEYEILKDNIGYIKITEFNNHTLENVLIALGEFDRNKIDKVIFDVRNNPGGSLREVIDVLRFLVPRGPIVHVKYSDGQIKTYFSYNDDVNFKLAVLTNKGSASASEIFAGAIQDTGVGTIIGTTTYGKGTVQSIIPLANGGGVKLTVAEYFTAKENPVDKVGIQPDVVVENTTKEDLQLKKAIEVLSKSATEL